MPPAEVRDLRTILYIDDDQDILTLVQMALEKIGGFAVHTLSSACKAVATAEEILPDLIILDVMMPELDGTSLVHSFRQSETLCETPIVFMTARVQPADFDKYMALGAAGIIPKPFNPLTLPQSIREIWGTFQRDKSESASGSFNELKQKYLSNLPAKRAAIDTFAKQAAAKKVTAAAVQKMEELAHNLAGSGGTYGYRAISTTARNFEKTLVASPYSPEFAVAAAKLLAAIDQALLDLPAA